MRFFKVFIGFMKEFIKKIITRLLAIPAIIVLAGYYAAKKGWHLGKKHGDKKK